jgi:hypothetical protein
MNKKPKSKTAEPPPVDAVKAKASAPVQFGPTVSTPGSRLKKR